jgi:5-hydroxyisourate hydrolase-like protein (transthyretin family)
MKKDAPMIANVLLEGVLPPDLKVPESDEKGVVVKKVATHPVDGPVTLDGKPVAGATVTFYRLEPDTEKYASVCDGRTDEQGRYKITTYSRFDGAPVGKYTLTVVKVERPADGGAGKHVLPKDYAAPTTSGLRFEVKAGSQTFDVDLKAK